MENTAMDTSSTSSSEMQNFTVQFDNRIALTPEQIAAIEHAISTVVAEQLVKFSVKTVNQPLPTPEGVPIREGWRILGRQFLAIPTEPPEVYG